MSKIDGKKINCRHDLNETQELEARKLKKKLAEGDVATLQVYRDMFLEYVKNSSGPYVDFIKLKNPVYYSALISEMERIGPKETYYKILNC